MGPGPNSEPPSFACWALMNSVGRTACANKNRLARSVLWAVLFLDTPKRSIAVLGILSVAWDWGGGGKGKLQEKTIGTLHSRRALIVIGLAAPPSTGERTLRPAGDPVGFAPRTFLILGGRSLPILIHSSPERK